MVDPDFGIMLRHNGRFLSAAEILSFRAAGKADEIELFYLADKPSPLPKFNFPVHFYGQMAWKPEYMKYPANIAEYYRRVVINRGYSGELRYFRYDFGSEPCELLVAKEVVDQSGW